jgi:23S rRNA (adenine2503-C2)-methyltransferase
MGMGEPFLNYETTIKALEKLNDPKGFNIGGRKITLSTIGIIEKIYKFAEEDHQFKLAISLHGPDDKTRRMLVPVASKYSINELINAAVFYSKKTNRRITYEYVLINKVNASAHHAQLLSDLIKGQNCHVNLIALNPIQNYDEKSPSEKTIMKFYNILLRNKISATIRNSLGSNINAGCGQLAGLQRK